MIYLICVNLIVLLDARSKVEIDDCSDQKKVDQDDSV